jgi:hypothetical protein
MKISVTIETPEWATGTSTSYETKFLYTGNGRIDVHAKVYQAFQHEDATFFLFERPFSGGVVSRSYSVEYATVTEYSKSPRRWKEETPSSTQYFAEISQ